jgi:EpsI family protein
LKPNRARFLAALVLIAGTGWLLHARTGNEIVPAHPPLASFPTDLAGWEGTDVPIDPASYAVLGKGDFLLRRYENPEAEEPFADLFIAYFASQRTGETMHSPKNCLPGSGWRPTQSRTVTMHLPGVAPFDVNQYVVAKGTERQLVLYWYYAHGRAVASEYRAKIELVLDAIKMNRSDGSLVRISTPMIAGETQEAAMQRLDALASQIVPRLDSYIPQ